MALPSLSAIKYTVTDSKTANINDKNFSLSTKLTARNNHDRNSNNHNFGLELIFSETTKI